ncbi:hypothetical protein MKW92_016332 [Papaver armeniacum]|nr:hypothetical protein MKW92_016332 [Papaver armeniacum]
MAPDASQALLRVRKSETIIHPIYLNREAKIADYTAADIFAGHLDPYSQHRLPIAISGDMGLDLNALDVLTSIKQNPFYPCEISDYVKSKGAAECESCNGPLEENDLLRVWKAMK